MGRNNTAEKIVERATGLFRDNGYFGTSMNDIAQSIGLKKASLYNHFRSKEDIAKAVITRLNDEFREGVYDVADDNSLEPTARLNKLSEFIYQFYAAHPGCVAASLSMGAPEEQVLPKQEIHSFVENWITALSKLLKIKYSEEKASQLAQEFLIKLQGALVVMRMQNQDRLVLRKVCDELSALID